MNHNVRAGDPEEAMMAKRAATSTASGDDAVASTATGGTNGSHAQVDPPKMTPAAALARHIEWLEYALGAARAEEGARADRVEKATKKNREKRGSRLAEARDEVGELIALLAGIRDLQAKARGARARKPAIPMTRAAARTPTTLRRRPSGTTASGS